MMEDDYKGEGLQMDLYEDCIMLMDEQQFAANRDIQQTLLGTLMRNDWTILMLPTSGSMEVEVAGEAYRCGVGQVMVCLLGDGIVARTFSPDFAGRTIGMSIPFVSGLNIGDALGSGLAVRRKPIVDIIDQTYRAINLIFDQLRGIMAASDNPYRFRAVQALVETYYYSIGYYLHRDTDTRRRTGSEALADQFLQLLRREYRQHRDLDHYADALYVSKKHLSATVAKVTGRPATHWVEHEVVCFAKQQLEHSNLSIGQIADELHFANQSHFGTYFKRATGRSPETYRRELRRGN